MPTQQNSAVQGCAQVRSSLPRPCHDSRLFRGAQRVVAVPGGTTPGYRAVGFPPGYRGRGRQSGSYRGAARTGADVVLDHERRVGALAQSLDPVRKQRGLARA